MSDPIRVGMADYKLASSPDTLITLGLGSCVGITLYSRLKKTGGMAHIMLPRSTDPTSESLKFADVAIKKMIEDLKGKGVRVDDLEVKIAGGAKMFSFSNSDDKRSIGHRNSVAVKKIIEDELHLKIISEDIGGTYGRTVELELETGDLKVKTIGHGTKVI